MSLKGRPEGECRSAQHEGSPVTLTIDPAVVEDVAKELYIRALKLLPPDVKAAFARVSERETDATAQRVLGMMVKNIAVAEATDNLLCQDTGIPIYNVTIGRSVTVDGVAVAAAIRRGCERATREHPLRSSVVHPVTRKNEHTSSGAACRSSVGSADASRACDRDDPQRLGLREQLVAQDGGARRRRRCDQAFVIDCVLDAGGKTCPPTIVGVGVGGTSDLCVHLSKVAATRPLGTAATIRKARSSRRSCRRR